MFNRSEHPLSWAAIFRVVTVGLLILFVQQVYVVILLLLVSAMLASALYPMVKYLNKWLPRSFASVVVVLGVITPVIILGSIIIPRLIDQYPVVTHMVTRILDGSLALPVELKNIDFTQYTGNIGSYIVKSTPQITSFLANFITVVFLTLYFLIDSERLKAIVLSFVPKKQSPKVEALFSDVAQVNGHYIRGNILISIICGITMYLGLKILRVPFAGPLASFAAIMDLLPLVGAFIGAVPAVLLAFSVSPTVGVLVICLYLVYQQAENAVIAPAVYTKTLDISPALSFIAVLIGASLLGVFGAFIALPIAASIPAILRYIREDDVKEPLEEVYEDFNNGEKT